MKKIIPIFLVICTVLSVFSIFTVPAYALAEGAAIVLLGLASFCIVSDISNIGSQAGGALAQTISDFERDHQSFLNSDNSIIYDTSTGSFSINGDYDYSSDIEYEIALDVVNELNKNAMNKVNYIVQSSRYTGFFEVEPSIYSEIKSTISDRVVKRLYAESQNKTMSDFADSAELPVISWDFVGPLPSLTVPSTKESISLSRDGYTFSVPHIFDTQYLTAAEANAIAASIPGSEVYEYSKDSYQVKFGSGCYGYSFYVIYEGKIYYSQTYTAYSSDPYTQQQRYFPLNTWASDFVAADGSKLAVGRVSLLNPTSPYTCGVVVNTDNTYNSGNPSFYPVGSDFEGESGGGTFEIPRTDDENNTGLGIGLGLINDSDSITLNPDGTFESVGGIDMSKLSELIDKLNTGSLDFENVQEYLELIAQLVGNSNLTAQEQAKLLANVQANVASLADIKIKSDYKFDVKTPDTIINKFPFCLPFDVYNVFNLLSAEPKTPKFTIPFEMEGIFNESITVDLSEFDTIAMIVRWLLYIIFILGLILVTNKLIGRG